MAARLGYDGVQVMVYTDPVSQAADALGRLGDYHQVPVLSVHAPGLLLTQRVWGREPWRSCCGPRTPPSGWAPGSSSSTRRSAGSASTPGFENGLPRCPRRPTSSSRWRTFSRCGPAGARWCRYAPHWDPTALDVPHITLDLSHTAASGSDALVMAAEIGGRLAHVHLADGTGEIPPGPCRTSTWCPAAGRQPCAGVLRDSTSTRYDGVVVVEVKTNRAPTREDRVADLTELLAFARKHLAGVGEAACG